jgi:hypothetical protein
LNGLRAATHRLRVALVRGCGLADMKEMAHRKYGVQGQQAVLNLPQLYCLIWALSGSWTRRLARSSRKISNFAKVCNDRTVQTTPLYLDPVRFE